jgi:cyclic-di-GMP-binding protein
VDNWPQNNQVVFLGGIWYLSLAMASLDIVSKVDQQELDNAVNQARKEILQRYDLKDAACSIKLEPTQLLLKAKTDFHLKAVLDVLKSKLVKRGLSLKAFKAEAIEPADQGHFKQQLTLQQGIPPEKAKAIVKSIKGLKLNVQSQIQGEQLRISGKKIDDLQSVIQMLTADDHGIHMDFVNMKS